MATVLDTTRQRGNEGMAWARLARGVQRRVRSGRRKAASLTKASYQRVCYDAAGPKVIGLIMGAQRSGTGMLVQAFDHDWACRTFGEDGGLALGPDAPPGMRWRWKPLDKVAGILRAQHAPLLIAKPLVESQRAADILQVLPDARIIWAYRHYRDVALSGQQHFGSETIRYNLASIVERRPHWYAEHVDEETRALVAMHFTHNRSVYDLRALGWYVRNSFYFRCRHLPVALCAYEDLVSEPARKMQALYEFLGQPYPGDQIVRHIHGRSASRGRHLRISPEIGELCDGMMAALAGRADCPRSAYVERAAASAAAG